MGIEEVKKGMRKEDGSLNWKFIFIGSSWKGFLLTTLFFIAILLMAYGYNKDTQYCNEFQSDPCLYISHITEKCMGDVGEYIRNPMINWSNVNIGVVENG